jgi:hypothetical protein
MTHNQVAEIVGSKFTRILVLDDFQLIAESVQYNPSTVVAIIFIILIFLSKIQK